MVCLGKRWTKFGMFPQDPSFGTFYSVNKWSLKDMEEGATLSVSGKVLKFKMLKSLIFGQDILKNTEDQAMT